MVAGNQTLVGEVPASFNLHEKKISGADKAVYMLTTESETKVAAASTSTSGK